MRLEFDEDRAGLLRRIGRLPWQSPARKVDWLSLPEVGGFVSARDRNVLSCRPMEATRAAGFVTTDQSGRQMPDPISPLNRACT